MLAFTVIIVVLIAGLGIFSLRSQQSSSTILTSPTTVAQSAWNASSSVLSPNGLRLVLSTPQTTFLQGSGIPINISLFNTLTTRNNLTGLPAPDLSLGLCSQLPIGIGIFTGYYDADNLSQGASLALSAPGVSSCPALYAIDYWSFAPTSDNITLVSLQPSGPGNATAPRDMWTQGAGADTEYLGYWSSQDASNPSTNITFDYFQPGAYTVAAEDAWGQVTLLHFLVALAPGSPIEVVSVIGPIQPYNPGGPAVGVTLKNVGDAPITFLNVTLKIEPPQTNPGGFNLPFAFTFNVSSSNPLLPGQSAQHTRILVGVGLQTGSDYPLTIDGAFMNGAQFSYTIQVQIIAPG